MLFVVIWIYECEFIVMHKRKYDEEKSFKHSFEHFYQCYLLLCKLIIMLSVIMWVYCDVNGNMYKKQRRKNS